MEQDAKNAASPPAQPQPEFDKKPGWKNPYFAYLVIVALLFVFLIIMKNMAIENDWIPNRGITQPR